MQINLVIERSRNDQQCEFLHKAAGFAIELVLRNKLNLQPLQVSASRKLEKWFTGGALCGVCINAPKMRKCTQTAGFCVAKTGAFRQRIFNRRLSYCEKSAKRVRKECEKKFCFFYRFAV